MRNLKLYKKHKGEKLKIYKLLIILLITFMHSLGCKKENPVENNNPVQTNLILYLPFNGNANDESGTGNNANLINATLTSDRYGNNNAAYYFNGTNNYISIPSSISLESVQTGISFSAWLYINEWYGGEFAPLIAKSNNSSHGMFGFQLLNFSTRKEFEVKLKGNSVNANYLFQKNQWYHIAFTWDGTNCKYFVNGSKFYERQWNNTLSPNNKPLLIGKDTPELTEYLNGKMDDIRIYDKAINEGQVDSLSRLNN